jgi:hypothetical protein
MTTSAPKEWAKSTLSVETVVKTRLFRVTAAADAYYAKHFVADFEQISLCAAPLDDTRNVPAKRVRQPILLDGRILPISNFEIDRVHTGSPHADQDLGGIWEREFHFVGAQNAGTAEVMHTHFENFRHSRTPFKFSGILAINVRPDTENVRPDTDGRYPHCW